MSNTQKKKTNVWKKPLYVENYTNTYFEQYYRQLFPWGSESYGSFQDFLSALQRPLPSAFRLSTTVPHHVTRIREILTNASVQLRSNSLRKDGGEDIDAFPQPTTQAEIRIPSLFESKRGSNEPLQTLAWAWEINLPRRAIRRTEGLQEFRRKLILETEGGVISRQETVSMLPVHYLDIQEGNTVLDLCAAPGSKTCQIMEKIASYGDGVVVANDIDLKRISILIRQCSRLTHALPHLLITQHCATTFPLTPYFDRILCDVMCSGDGTLRKAPDLWVRWKPQLALVLHPMQRRVLQRALRILRPGGKLVYSTCSLHPVENEAVVFSCLTPWKGAVKIIDARPLLPCLKFVSGLVQWNVMDPEGDLHTTLEHVPEEMQSRYRFTSSMFPPNVLDQTSLELRKTIRILPHAQDTGGFYIAVLSKDEAYGTRSEYKSYLEDENRKLTYDTAKGESKNSTRSNAFVHVEEQLRKKITEALNLKSDFPWRQCLIRAETRERGKVFALCPSARRFIDQLQHHVVHLGVRVFQVEQRSKLASEGLPFVYPFLHSTHARTVNINFFSVLVEKVNQSFATFIGDEASISEIQEKPTPRCVIFCPEVYVFIKLRWDSGKRSWTHDHKATYWIWVNYVVSTERRVLDEQRAKEDP